MQKKIHMMAVLVLFIAAYLFPLDGNVDSNDNDSPFNLDPVLDGILFTTSVGLNGMVLYFDKLVEVNHFDFGGTTLYPSQVKGFDQLLMNSYSPVLNKLGTGIGIFSILTPAILFTAPTDQWLTIGTMYAETITLAYSFKELGKLCIYRDRPYMYFEGVPRDVVDDHDWNKSFPSGHTTLSFAGASFTSFVFSKYFPDSKWKIPVIVSSYAAAIGTAACRIASGDHFLTDVIAGAVVGTACGLFIPWIHSLNINIKEATTESTQEFSVHAMLLGAILNIGY